MKISALNIFPVKALDGYPIETTQLTLGQIFPGDRMYRFQSDIVIERDGIRKLRTQHVSLTRTPELAKIKFKRDPQTGLCEFDIPDHEVFNEIDLENQDDRKKIQYAVSKFLISQNKPAVEIVGGPDHAFPDFDGYISLFNPATAKELAEETGQNILEDRFRSNILLDGLEPWEERNLVGNTLLLPSGAEIDIIENTERCATIAMNPKRQVRDFETHKYLIKTRDHKDCGIYGIVKKEGSITRGNSVKIL